MAEPEPLTDEAGVIALDYIIDSPPHQHGGFHPHTVAVAKWAKATIAELRAEVEQLTKALAYYHSPQARAIASPVSPDEPDDRDWEDAT